MNREAEWGRMMEFANRTYSEAEVTQIIRRALAEGGAKGTIEHEELVEIARASGISREGLENAIRTSESSEELDAAKTEWTTRHRRGFYRHLTAYAIVNGFLVAMNLVTLVTVMYFWAIWPMLGWGIGLAFHAVAAFRVSDAEVERRARRLIKAKRRQRESKEFGGPFASEIGVS